MAQTIFIAGGPRRGIPVYIMKKFDFVQMLESVQKYRITNLTMVPPIVVVHFPVILSHFLPPFDLANRVVRKGISEIALNEEI